VTEADFALRLSGQVVAAAVILSSAESLAAWRDFAPGGILDCRLSEPPAWMSSRLGRALRPTLARLMAVSIIRLAASIALLCPSLPAAAVAWCALLALVAGLIFHRLSVIGTDGADQISNVVLASIVAGSMTANSAVTGSALWFIAAHACLAYFLGGFFKAVSPSWRSGVVLTQILSLESLGHAPVRDWLARRPETARVLAWSVIGLELLFPLALFAPPWLMWCTLAATLSLHIAIATMMGLNTFVWGFGSTYPAVFFTNSQLRAFYFG